MNPLEEIKRKKKILLHYSSTAIKDIDVILSHIDFLTANWQAAFHNIDT